jgi:hypothetical protein
MSEKLVQIIKFYPAYDRRHRDPAKDYGIGSVCLVFVLQGTQGAVTFTLATGWYLPHVQMKLVKDAAYRQLTPFPMDLGVHALGPQYSGQSKRPACDWTTQGYCYYDGSTLNADPFYTTLVEKGSGGVWEELEKYYYMTFNT